jgi:hypothetical protein
VYYELSREQEDIRRQAQACHQALIELEARAGIAETALASINLALRRLARA